GEDVVEPLASGRLPFVTPEGSLTMTRLLLAAAVLAAPAPGSRAADPAVRLGVRPMAAPRPALKYLLLPEVGELKPGNPVQWYARCFMEQRNFFYGKGAVEERARYRSMPPAE